MIANWPLIDEMQLTVDAESVSNFKSFQALVRSVRNARAEYKVENNKKIAANVGAEGDLLKNLGGCFPRRTAWQADGSLGTRASP